MSTRYRFYGDLARWWPLISPPEDYTEEAEFAATLLRSAAIPVREVLELGSGGGHNASHLRRLFTMTLVDLSADMLPVKVNGRQFVVLPVAQANGTFPMTFNNPADSARAAGPGPGGPPEAAAQGGQAGAGRGDGRQGRGGGGPALPGAYIAFALPQ